MVDLRVANEP